MLYVIIMDPLAIVFLPNILLFFGFHAWLYEHNRQTIGDAGHNPDDYTYNPFEGDPPLADRLI